MTLEDLVEPAQHHLDAGRNGIVALGVRQRAVKVVDDGQEVLEEVLGAETQRVLLLSDRASLEVLEVGLRAKPAVSDIGELSAKLQTLLLGRGGLAGPVHRLARLSVGTVAGRPIGGFRARRVLVRHPFAAPFWLDSLRKS